MCHSTVNVHDADLLGHACGKGIVWETVGRWMKGEVTRARRPPQGRAPACCPALGLRALRCQQTQGTGPGIFCWGVVALRRQHTQGTGALWLWSSAPRPRRWALEIVERDPLDRARAQVLGEAWHPLPPKPRLKRKKASALGLRPDKQAPRHADTI